MLTAALLLITNTLITSPLGQNELEWGISEQALIAQYDVVKVDTESPQRQHFTEFQEVNPVVYIDRSTPGQKKEFYFYESKLYKTLVVHLNQEDSHARYQEKITTLSESLGKPSQQHQSMMFNLPVLHTIWDFENEQYDLRFGAGYVYEVRTHTPTANKKKARESGWIYTQREGYQTVSLL